MDFDREYDDLRLKLNAMNYNEPLGYDSLLLIKKLVRDLDTSSDTKLSLEKQVEAIRRESISAIKQGIPLKKENNRLSRENSQLHLEMINQAEEIDAKERVWERERKVLQGKMKEFQFLMNQKSQSVKDKEIQLEKLAHQHELLLARISKSGKHYTTASTKGIELDRVLNDTTCIAQQEIKTSHTKEFPVHSVSSPLNNIQEQSEGESMEHLLATHSGATLVQQLQKNNQQLQAENRAVREEKNTLVKQLATREAKISELIEAKHTAGMGNAMYSSADIKHDVSPDKELQRSMDLKHQFLMSTTVNGPSLSFTPSSTGQHLHQIDFLSSQVAAYEKKLKSTDERLRRVDKERLELLASQERVKHTEDMTQEYKKQVEVMQAKLDQALRLQPDPANMRTQESQTEREFWSVVDTVLASPSTSNDAEDVIEQLTQQKRQLEHALVTYQQDKRKFVQELTQAHLDVKTASDKSDVHAEREIELTKKMQLLQEELRHTRSKLLMTENELSMQQEALLRLQRSTASGSDRTDVLHRQIEALENMVVSQKQDNGTLKEQLDEVLVHKNQLATQLSLKQSAADTTENVEITNNSMLLQQLTAERNTLQTEIEKMHEAQGIQRDASETEISQLQNEKEAERRQLQSEKQELQVKLDSLKLQVRRLEATLTRLGPLEQELPNAVQGLKERVVAMQNELIEKETKEIDLQNEIRALHELVQEYERDSLVHQAHKDRLVDDLEKLNEQNIEIKQARQRSELTWENKQKRYLEDHERLTQLLDVENARTATLREQLDERVKALYDSERQMLDVQESVSARDLDLKLLGKELEDVKRQHTKAVTETKRLQDEKDDLERKMYHMDHQLAKHERSRKHEQDLRKQTERFAVEQQDNIDSLSQQTVDLERELKQLKSLLNQMEIEREELRRETYAMQREQKSSENDKRQLQELVTNMQQKQDNLKVELTTSQEALQHLDGQRDALQQELDQQVEKNTSLQQDQQNHQFNEEHTQQQLQGALSQVDILTSQVVEAEKLVEQLHYELRVQNENLDQIKQRLKVKTTELSRTTDDLVLMTNENQHLGQECSKLNQHVVELRQQMEELQSDFQQLDNTAHTKDIQLTDLMHTYRVVCDELQSLKTSEAEAGSLKTHLQMKEKTWMESRNEYDSILQGCENDKLGLQQQIQIYASQVTQLTQQIQTLQNQLQKSKHEVQATHKESTTQQLASKFMNKEHSDLQQRSALTMEQVVALESRMETIQHENELKHSELNKERQQKMDLEGLITSLRSQKVNLQDKLTVLSEERSAMAEEIRHLQQKSAEVEVFSAENAAGINTPLHQARQECEELESKLVEQSKTVLELEDSKKKFQQFAAKYEQEIAKRDEIIKTLSPGGKEE